MQAHSHGQAGHSHDHDHSYGLGGHAHVHLPLEGMTGILGAAVVATFILVAVELAAGYAGHSIALISDALHNLTDVPTLVISWLGMRWAKRPPTAEKTYGYHRAGILAAFVNAMLLAILSLFLVYESVARLRHPVAVQTGIMLWVSLFALVINSGIALAVHSGRHDLNIRGVWIHNLGDRHSPRKQPHPFGRAASGNAARCCGCRSAACGRRARGSRYSCLDFGNRFDRTVVPRLHSRHAYGG